MHFVFVDFEALNNDAFSVKHASLVGVADPTDSIPQGHVFLTGFKSTSAPSKVFLTRSPCAEAADGKIVPVFNESQILFSEDYQSLSKLPFGFVVFPLGKPSLVSKINSSDLDGDLFFAMWDEPIVHEAENNSRNEVIDPNVSFVKTPWNGALTSDHWFKEVQKSLILKRSFDVNSLNKRCHRYHKAAVKNHGPNDIRAIAWGRAWKHSQELEKHVGRIELPLDCYNEITGRNKSTCQTQLQKRLESLVLPNGKCEEKNRSITKPLFEVNDKVYAPWDNREWYLGVVIDYNTLSSGPFGPNRKYSIRFDDDESERAGIEDFYVFSERDYVLQYGREGYVPPKWIGVKNKTDKKSKDYWAKAVGWYQITVSKYLSISSQNRCTLVPVCLIVSFFSNTRWGKS